MSRSKILQLEPARAKSANEKKLSGIWNEAGWVAEEKLDGWRYLLHIDTDLLRPHLTGRRISKETGLFSEKGMNAPCLWPSGTGWFDYTVLDGEIMPPLGAGFRDLASIMNADPKTAAETIKRIGEPIYRVFDILFADGEDVRHLSMLERHAKLIETVREIAHPSITVIPSLPPTLQIYESIVDAGGEGVILKDTSATYGESGGWIKVKRFSTLDVVVTGFTDAKEGRTGKFLGQIGAAQVSVYLSDGSLAEVGKVSGMTDDIRLDMTANPGQWLGTVIEVAAQEFGKDRLRHPRYKRHRPDADPRHATYAKLRADLGAGTEEQREEQRVVKGEQQILKL
jgi:bifunctional non-homologous end joining protein LigD